MLSGTKIVNARVYNEKSLRISLATVRMPPGLGYHPRCPAIIQPRGVTRVGSCHPHWLRLTFLLEIVLNQDIIFMTDLFCHSWWTLGMLFSFFHLKDFIIIFLIFIYLTMLGLSCITWNLVPQPGIELRLPALGAQSLSHWTTRKSQDFIFLKEVLGIQINEQKLQSSHVTPTSPQFFLLFTFYISVVHLLQLMNQY